MNRQELIEKLEQDSVLEPMEKAMLDAFLEDDRNGFVVQAIRNVPQEEPSLSWRSELNERLLTVAELRSARPRFFTFPKLISATALIGAVAFAFISFVPKKSEIANEQPSLSESLVEWHQTVASSMILPGDGTAVEDFVTTNEFKPSETDDLLYGGEEITRL